MESPVFLFKCFIATHFQVQKLRAVFLAVAVENFSMYNVLYYMYFSEFVKDNLFQFLTITSRIHTLGKAWKSGSLEKTQL